MAIAAAAPAPELLRRAVRLQVLTIVWMSVEAIVASTAAWTARSPALLGFSGDSAIELFSAITVLWRFRSKSELAVAEQLAARVTGGLLFVVAGFVIVSSELSLLGHREAQPSIIGIDSKKGSYVARLLFRVISAILSLWRQTSTQPALQG